MSSTSARAITTRRPSRGSSTTTPPSGSSGRSASSRSSRSATGLRRGSPRWRTRCRSRCRAVYATSAPAGSDVEPAAVLLVLLALAKHLYHRVDDQDVDDHADAEERHEHAEREREGG